MWFHVYKYKILFLGDFKKSCYTWEPCFLCGKINGGLLLLMFSANLLVLLSIVRKGYRIQADKERDSMKVLYYVEKELAQFDPARRMRGRCEHLLVLCNLCIMQEFIGGWGGGVTKLGQPLTFRVRTSRDADDTILKKVVSSTQMGENNRLLVWIEPLCSTSFMLGLSMGWSVILGLCNPGVGNVLVKIVFPHYSL